MSTIEQIVKCSNKIITLMKTRKMKGYLILENCIKKKFTVDKIYSKFSLQVIFTD